MTTLHGHRHAVIVMDDIETFEGSPRRYQHVYNKTLRMLKPNRIIDEMIEDLKKQHPITSRQPTPTAGSVTSPPPSGSGSPDEPIGVGGIGNAIRKSNPSNSISKNYGSAEWIGLAKENG